MKTLKEFMQENEVTGFSVINDILVSALVGQSTYGLDVDTSSIVAGTTVTNVSEFSIDGDSLTVNHITLNTAETNMLGFTQNTLS